MAKIQPKIVDATFTIIEPGGLTQSGGTVLAVADSAHTVYVRVQNFSGDAATFTAQIVRFGTTTTVGPSKTLAAEDGTNHFYIGCVDAGSPLPTSPTGTPNRTLLVTRNGSAQPSPRDFEAVQGGSGSSGSCSGGSLVGSHGMLAARPAALAGATGPVPVALSLQADASAAPGDAESGHLDRPTTLSYSGVAADECCWLSPPVDAFSDRSAPAFWMLRTADARAWVLILRRGDSDVVVYHFTAPGEKGGAFPIQMHLAAGGHAWPRSVTVSPAL